MSARPRYAVIGTGAAALGVLEALLEQESLAEITLIDVAEPTTARIPALDLDSASDIAAFYADLYRELFGRHPRQFPPPKTHLGERIPRHRMSGGQTLYKSEAFGGLTRFWGGTMLPFTDAELASWPFDAKLLYPYYARLAERVGLAGGHDELLQYFGRDFATRPAMRPLTALRRLSDSVNHHGRIENNGYRVLAGINRCAVETRDDSPRACVYCGECMAGCVKGAIFSSAHAIDLMLREGRVGTLIRGRVTRIDLERRVVVVDSGSGEQQLGDFSKVFLCAGCVGSTEILMRSGAVPGRATMTDNSVHVFPVFNFGRGAESGETAYFGLCNIILACVPTQPGDHLAQVQIYPNFDYMWRYNIPPALWSILHPLVRASRGRIFWARLYLHSSLSQSYRLHLDEDQLVIEEVRAAKASAEARRLLSILRNVVNRSGFYIPPMPPIPQRTNSHYGGTLPFGSGVLNVPVSGEIGNGVYLCDSSTFPDTPAASLTFTLMANAARIAAEAEHG